LPWAFKWLIAPLVDLIRLHRFGGRKAWIVFCTTMMIATLLMTVALDLVADFELLLAVIVLNNVFCATQDVAMDALAISTLKEEERGRANGFMFGGQYLGIALGGGGAIFVLTASRPLIQIFSKELSFFTRYFSEWRLHSAWRYSWA